MRSRRTNVVNVARYPAIAEEYRVFIALLNSCRLCDAHGPKTLRFSQVHEQQARAARA
jgi:hypothetical protein